MKKKIFAMYALIGALVASPVFTSCVDDSVSDSVEALRDANVKYKNAQAAQAEASAALNQANAENVQAMTALELEAQRLENEATAAENAYNKALNDLDLADKEYQASLREYKQALQEKKDSIEIERLQLQLEQNKATLEQTLADIEEKKIANEKNQIVNEKDKATLELNIEYAKIQAQANIATQKVNLQEQEKKLAQVLESLNNKVKNEAKTLNGNANAIMMGGTFYTGIFNANGTEETIKYGAKYNEQNTTANSIIALMSEIATENANLLSYNAGLVSINEWIREQTATYNQSIAANEAKIALYKELQASGTLADMKKAYEEAVKNNESYSKQIAEKSTAAYNAQKAINDYESAELNKIGTEEENAVYAYIQKNKPATYSLRSSDEFYLTRVPYIGAETEDDTKDDSEEGYYVYTEDNAQKLADAIAAFDAEDGAITEAKNNVATRLDEIEKAKKKFADQIVEAERTLAVENAKLVANQKIYNDVIASEGYKAALKKLQDDVTAAKAAFDANPTSELDENGDPVTDPQTGKPVGTKELLKAAEKALKNFDYQYAGADTEGTGDDKMLSDLEYLLTKSYEVDGEEYEGMEGYVATWTKYIKKAKAYTDEDYDGFVMEENRESKTLVDLEAAVEAAEAAKQELVDLQTLLAPESEAMVAYNAWAEGLAELVEAKQAVADEVAELKTQQEYWSGIESSLSEYVEGKDSEEAKLPDYAELIEELNAEIAEAKASIASLAATDKNSDSSSSSSTEDPQNKISMESVIKQTEAKIAAMEAELERNQADYDAIIKELDALVNAETAE